MKHRPSVSQLGAIMANTFRRFHVLLFVLTVVIGVAVCMFFLNNLITLSGQAEVTPSAGPQFDEETIKRVDSLVTPDQGTSGKELVLPPGRVNPFVE